jgi:hypothetical protein
VRKAYDGAIAPTIFGVHSTIFEQYQDVLDLFRYQPFCKEPSGEDD